MTIDPRQAKLQQRKIWDANAPGWKKWWNVYEPSVQAVSDTLLDLADVQPGQWVLDVATGAGEPALTAARRVGAAGKVVGIDQSKRMLAFAEERARAAGLSTVGFQELDAEALGTWPEASYDAALCRFGLTYLPQLAQGLRGIHHVLTRSAPLAVAIWSAAERVPALALPSQVLGDLMTLPEALVGPLSPFALAERGVLEQALSSAGFKGIRAERMTVVSEFASATAWTEFVRDTSVLGPVVAEKTAERQAEIWAKLAEAAAPFAAADGKVSFVGDLTCVVGRKG